MSEAHPGHKLIVAYLVRGEAHRVAEALHASLGHDAFHYDHRRGTEMLHAIAIRDMIEVDTLSVVVTEQEAEETFSFIHETAGIGRPGGGLMIQMALDRAAALGLPLPPEPAATGETAVSG